PPWIPPLSEEYSGTYEHDQISNGPPLSQHPSAEPNYEKHYPRVLE
ncbi:MAG: hypothetical protein ACJAUP_001398, partial [Cellvibrionaceae bacterium]